MIRSAVTSREGKVMSLARRDIAQREPSSNRVPIRCPGATARSRPRDAWEEATCPPQLPRGGRALGSKQRSLASKETVRGEATRLPHASSGRTRPERSSSTNARRSDRPDVVGWRHDTQGCGHARATIARANDSIAWCPPWAAMAKKMSRCRTHTTLHSVPLRH